MTALFVQYKISILLMVRMEMRYEITMIDLNNLLLDLIPDLGIVWVVHLLRMEMHTKPSNCLYRLAFHYCFSNIRHRSEFGSKSIYFRVYIEQILILRSTYEISSKVKQNICAILLCFLMNVYESDMKFH